MTANKSGPPGHPITTTITPVTLPITEEDTTPTLLPIGMMTSLAGAKPALSNVRLISLSASTSLPETESQNLFISNIAFVNTGISA